MGKLRANKVVKKWMIAHQPLLGSTPFGLSTQIDAFNNMLLMYDKSCLVKLKLQGL